MNATIVRLGLRAVFGRSRGLLLIVLPLVLLALAVLVRVFAGTGQGNAESITQLLGVGVVLPLVALIATSSLLGPETDDGSIAYLLAKPVSRLSIVTSKLVVAMGCVVVCAVLPMVVAALVLDPDGGRLWSGYALGSLAGGAAYCVAFTVLSLLTRHAVVLGLVYVLIWEGVLGGLLDGIRWVSVARWVQSIADGVAGRAPDPGLGYALAACLLVVVGGGLLAARRLSGFNLTSAE